MTALSMGEGKQPVPDADGAGTDRADQRVDERDEVPTLRDEIRTAAQYGLFGRWAQKRRNKVAAELERNRRGDYKVPTWVLAVILVAFVAGWVLLIVLS